MKKKEKGYIKVKISKLTISQKLPNVVNKNKVLLMAFNGKGLYPSVMVDKES